MSKKVKRYNGEDGSEIKEPRMERVFDKEAGRYRMLPPLLPEDVRDLTFDKPEKKTITKSDLKSSTPQSESSYEPKEGKKGITKADLKPSATRGGGAGMGGAGADVPGLKIGTKKKLDYAKGGKVAGKLATRGYGCVKK